MARVTDLRELRGRIAQTKVKQKRTQMDLDEARKAFELVEEARVLTKAALGERGKLRDEVAILASLSLQAALGDNYTFWFEDVKGGYLPRITENMSESSPLRQGGAARASSGSGLQLGTVLINPELSKLLIWDEPNRNFSQSAYTRWQTWLGLLAEKTPLQAVFVTHHLNHEQETLPDIPNTQVIKVERQSTWSVITTLSFPRES